MSSSIFTPPSHELLHLISFCSMEQGIHGPRVNVGHTTITEQEGGFTIQTENPRAFLLELVGAIQQNGITLVPFIGSTLKEIRDGREKMINEARLPLIDGQRVIIHKGTRRHGYRIKDNALVREPLQRKVL